MKQRRFFLHISFWAIGFVLFFLAQGTSFVSAKQENEDSSLFQELKVFTDVIAIIKRDYVKDINNKQLVEGAIKGMLTTLDPHSGYLDRDFYQDLQVQTKGEFGGLGIEITIKDGLLVVVAPMEGSPAERAGLKPQDAIVKIEGKFTKEYSLVDAVKKLRGPKGSPIHISVFRKGVPDLIDFTLVRDNIQVKSVRSRYLGDGLGYIRINQFMERTSEDLKSALKSLATKSENKEIRGLVLDLRNNPGGLLTQAIMVSDMFIKEGIIVYTDGRLEGQKQKYYAHDRGTEPDYPLVVLVNGGSASASEIVAGCLKDHGRALILGVQSFGKGSVQTITPLDNGGAVTLTTALYFTKSGNSIQAKGVSPDIEVSDTTDIVDPASEAAKKRILIREENLPGAIANPSEKKGTGRTQDSKDSDADDVQAGPAAFNPETAEMNDWLKRDRQFQRAYDLLKTFDVFKVQKLAAGEESK